MKRVLATVIAVGAGVALLGGTAMVQAARKAASTKEQRAQIRQSRQKSRHVGKAHRGGRTPDNVVGTITYDPGAPPDSAMGGPTGNEIIANRFNTALGAPLRAGNVTAVTFFPAVVNATAVVSVLGPPSGTTAPVLDAAYLSGVAPGTFNTATLVTPVAVGPDFMAGMYVGSFGGPGDQIGLRAASVGGQGFHAMQMHFIGTIATGVAPIPGNNVMFRATGNVLTPVELMNFSLQ